MAFLSGNEGNKFGLLAGIKIVDFLRESPVSIVAADGNRFIIAHMERQLEGLNGEFHVAICAHYQKPKITRDAKER